MADAPTQPAGAAQQRPRFFERLSANMRNFWARVTAGLETDALWRQFVSEAREGYGHYSREVDWEAQHPSRFRRFIFIVRSFFWVLLLKLSPPRRLILLVALGLLFFAVFATKPEGLLWLAAIIIFVLLALELADRVTMKRDLQIAREIQGWLVPIAAPDVPGIEIAFITRPANTVSGDYYDAFWRGTNPADSTASQPSDRRLFLAVADVAGKSVPAALLMATLQASLHTLAVIPSTLEQLVSQLNQYACAHSAEGRRFTTAFLAELDPHTRALRYVNAGHNAPILLRAVGGVDRLDRGGVPLGVDPDAKYEIGEVTLQSGDSLIVFTDGVVEALNEQGNEFGEPRLLNLVRPLQSASANLLRDLLMAELNNFTGSARQHDDITCLTLRVIPQAAPQV
jgi:phosphoserine phosphatase RsbU/P